MNFVKVQMQKIAAIVLLSTLLFPAFSKAQSREMGLMVGVIGYRGDLNSKMYSTKLLHPAIGLVYRRSYNNYWSFKAAFNFGRVEGDDSRASDGFSKNRNLNFRSNITELTGQYEFNFFAYQTANPATRATPYLLCGLSVFRFNPQALYNGDWVNLQPLGTEGQGTTSPGAKKPYDRTSYALVYGGGFKWKIGRRWGFVLETAVRRTHTDYLDDVSTTYADPNLIRKEYGKTAAILSDRSISTAPGGDIGRQRGDSSKKDWYVFTGIQITYTLSKRYIDSCRPFRLKL